MPVEGIAVKLFLLFLLLLFLLLLILLLSLSSLSSGILLALRGFGITSLFAGPHTEPLRKFASWALGELCELLLPHCLQPLGPQDFGATLVQLLSVSVCPGVCPTLVL